MIPVLRLYGCSGTWDQSMLEDAVAGDLWPSVTGFGGDARPQDEGAVILAHGPLVTRNGGTPAMRAMLAGLPWALVYHTSDEGAEWDSAVLESSKVRVIRQYPRPGDARGQLLGFTPFIRRELAKHPRLGAGGRRLWAFAGQAQNESRRRMLDVLSTRDDGMVHLSAGFRAGLPEDEYAGLLAETAVVPCPIGNCSPDTFRAYEALEAGCLPVTERTFPGWPAGFDFWAATVGVELGEQAVPWPVVDDWSELPPMLDAYRDDRGPLEDAMLEARAWWIGYKRRVALDLLYHVAALGGRVPLPRCTVLIPSSPIRAHPDIDMIRGTIQRIRAYPELETADVIVMLDGVREEQADRCNDYREYKRRLVEACAWAPDMKGVYPLVFREHTHQAQMTRVALRYVRTPLLMFVEHDTWPTGRIAFGDIFRAVESGAANTVRLHYDTTIHESHRSLMATHHPVDVGGIPAYQTVQWSQRPHVSRVDWYRSMLHEAFSPDSRCMIEDPLYSVICSQPWEQARVVIYAPEQPEGNIKRSATVDGRGADWKYPMVHVHPSGRRTDIGAMPGKE